MGRRFFIRLQVLGKGYFSGPVLYKRVSRMIKLVEKGYEKHSFMFINGTNNCY